MWGEKILPPLFFSEEGRGEDVGAGDDWHRQNHGKKLGAVGITTVEELAEAGSREAVRRLRARYPSTCVVILYHLEAALQGVGIKELDSACKAELRDYFRGL